MDRSKTWRIGQLLRSPDAWDREEEALELAYSMDSEDAKSRALKRIADRMCQPR